MSLAKVSTGMRSALLIALTISLALISPIAAHANTYDVGAEASADYIDAQPVDAPSPAIPDRLKEDALKLDCEARFTIDESGKTTVKLLTSSGSDEIDDITLHTLRRWKFKPAMLDGKPVASTRRLKVEFEVD